jgi:hypothetical protein
VLALFVQQGLMEGDRAEALLCWKNSGFSVDGSIALRATDPAATQGSSHDVAALALPPEQRILGDPADHMRHLVSQSTAQSHVPGRIPECRFGQLLLSLFEELDRYLDSFRSSSENTSPAVRQPAVPSS